MCSDKEESGLCPAGLVLRAEIDAGIKQLDATAKRVERSCCEVTTALDGLKNGVVEYKSRVVFLEKAYEELKVLASCIQKLKQDFAEHKGEHEGARKSEEQRLKEATAEAAVGGGRKGAKYGTVFGSFTAILVLAILQLIEEVKNFFASHWGGP